DRRPLLALRGPDLDPRVHLRVSDLGRTWADDGAHARAARARAAPLPPGVRLVGGPDRGRARGHLPAYLAAGEGPDAGRPGRHQGGAGGALLHAPRGREADTRLHRADAGRALRAA